MRARLVRAGAVAWAGLLVTAGAACGSGGDAPDADPATEPPVLEQTSPSGDSGGGDGDYAFGTDRDQIAEAVEGAFSTQNGTARWEGDTLVLSVDGDAGGPIAGFTECRVLDGLLQEGDAKVVEFPNGRVDCAETLSTG